MAFKRVIELTVGADGTGLLISDLNVEFNITRSITFEENIAEFIIYNAKEDTRKQVLREGNNLIFKAGYEDEGIGTIFIGNITKSISTLSGPDWITRVESATIQTSKKPLTNNYISLSYSADTPLSQPLQDIASSIGLGLFGIENVIGIILENGFTFAGSARNALVTLNKKLKTEERALYADNEELVIYRLDQKTSRFSPILLDYESGLLKIDDITEKDNQTKKNPRRVSIETILIPKLQPLVLAKVKNTSSLDGVYFAEKVITAGDNFGGPFNMTTEAADS
jgi:hypothetical protein